MTLEDISVDDASIGRILHVVDGSRSLCRPAIVLTDSNDKGEVNLSVFIEGPQGHTTLYHIVPNHLEKVATTWHWPRECKNLKRTS